ncbi:hypothetical protein NPIL_104911 [Nephila pilipes]|uniref:Uncharacterized protein n=1 Tax=Nephila pilipes TaxID=299642 RepID=A0A8X6N5H8_NEPPI|nr:hypothetical protein NPIL_104911 [Nephila pilipes]
MPDDASIDSDTSKPSVISDYSKIKGGVDIVDKLRGIYTVARRTLGWPMQRRFIPSLMRSSKNIIKRQFNELEAIGPGKTPRKKRWCNL